jgi:ATPases of the AAA+ class
MKWKARRPSAGAASLTKDIAEEANKLANEIEALARDCEVLVQPLLEMENVTRYTTTDLFKWDFVNRAICVCNADDRVSSEEGTLFFELFNRISARYATRNGAVIQSMYRAVAPAQVEMERPFFLEALDSNDQLRGTDYGQRVRGLTIRMLKLFASAEGVRNEPKLAYIAETERSLLQATTTQTVAPVQEQTATREAGPTTATKSAPLQEILDELDGLTGLNTVKQDVRHLANYVKVRQIRQAKGLKISGMSYHMVFYGKPGTGKTTVARLIAEIYRALGVISKGHLVEVDRAKLVGEWLGHTAVRTTEVVNRALGGILFIDEAYTLAPETRGWHDWGQEAIETLLKLMEDHRDDLVVIVAGYPDEMRRFISANPGIQSRFNKYLSFDDYTPEELVSIFNHFCNQNDYRLTDPGRNKLAMFFQSAYKSRDKMFGNARLARNIFELAIESQSNRILKMNMTGDVLTTIEASDITIAILRLR